MTTFVTGAVSDDKQNPQDTVSIRPLPLIRNDFIFNGAEGTVTKSEDKWVFIVDSDITDSIAVVKAGQPIELIPSATLERIIAGAEKTQDKTGVKLWASVTKYNDKNYLFAWYFIPMTDMAQPEIKKPDNGPAEQQTQTAEKPKDDSIIPDDIMARLKPRRVVNLAKLKKVLETEENALLVDRTGFLLTKKGQKVFQLDSLGRKLQDMSFKLLPCEALEWTEYKISQSINPNRYRIAGTVTKFKGEYYMLLQRAVRTYSHGNFVR
jgi:hypothetical protein